jgi:membrane protein implicated in regulation of membrane protease activity
LEPGTKVDVTATDPEGRDSETVEVTVDKPSAPIVDPSDGSEITGKADPGNTVTVTDPKTGEELCRTIVAADGTFHCDLNPALPDNTEVTVTATDPEGRDSDPTDVTTHKPSPPVVDPSDGSEITGQADPGDTVTVTDPGTGDVICQTVAGPDGTFRCQPDEPLEPGTKVDVTATDPEGRHSETVEVTVHKPSVPKLDPSDGTQITGTADPGATVVVTRPDTGQELCRVTAGTDGRFTCPLQPPLADGTVVNVHAVDDNGFTSDKAQVTVVAPAPPRPPQPITGATLGAWCPGLGLGFLALGTWFFLAAWRRRRTEEDPERTATRAI